MILLLIVFCCGAAAPVLTPPPASTRALPTDEEPLRDTFLMAAADAASAHAQAQWRSSNNCVSCHTNGLYLVSGAMEPAGQPWREARAFAIEYIDRYRTGEREPLGQYGAVEGMVSTACFLALGDRVMFDDFTPQTRAALDFAFSLQSQAGHWPSWLACNWPPYESDLHFGPSLMAIAMGRAPEDYLRQPNVVEGMARLSRWLHATKPNTLHQKGMLLWAHSEGGFTMSQDTRAAWLQELLATQRSDGGWCMASLGDWSRRDGADQLDESEAYATAFCLWIITRCGMAPDAVEVRKAVAWLHANQRASGRWFSRSQRADTRHYLSNAATNMATMALRSASRVPPRPRPRDAAVEGPQR
jgi:squalene-hopene/tetraprenyl-beta-curcumene cyclase